MKVALVYFDALAPGGYPRDLRWLAGALADRGTEVFLVARPGLDLDGIGGAQVVDPRTFKSIEPIVDLVHFWGIFQPNQLRLLFGLKCPIVLSPFSHLAKSHMHQRGWKKYPYLAAVRHGLSRKVGAVHSYSSFESADVRRVFPRLRQFRASVGLFPTAGVKTTNLVDRQIVFFGRNDVYQKGIDILLEGYAESRRLGLTLPLVLAGRAHGNSDKTIGSIVKDLNIEDFVRMAGPLPDENARDQLLSSARVFVFLSRWDGPPRPLREAIALGTPVIVSPGTNLADVVLEHGAGTCANLTARSIAEALLLAEDDNVVARWRTGSSQLKVALTWENAADQYIAGYVDVLGHR